MSAEARQTGHALGGATAVVAHTTAAVLQELRTKAKLRGVAISPTSTGSKLQLSVALANNCLEVGCAAGKLPFIVYQKQSSCPGPGADLGGCPG